MKKPITFRLDQDLLDKARSAAMAENRTLTNFLETVLKAEIARNAVSAAAAVTKTGRDGVKKTRGLTQ